MGITDEQFERALLDQDNRRIISSVTGRYDNILSPDSRKECGLIALWKTIQKHRPGMGRKFTTSLYQFLKWECDREVRKIIRPQLRPVHFEDFPSNEQIERTTLSEDLQHLVKSLENLPDKHKKLLKAYYFDNQRLADISREEGCSVETIRLRLKRSRELLKGTYLGVSSE